MGQRSSSLSHPKIVLARLLRGSQYPPLQKRGCRGQHADSSQLNFPSQKDPERKKKRESRRSEKFEHRFDLTSEKEVSTTREKSRVKRAVSEPNLAPGNSKSECRHGRSRRYQKSRSSSFNQVSYEIADVDSYLTKATIENPANIPVVLSFASVLYQTQGGTQDEVALPLGTIVNAIFKNQTWLYVQTPHGQEGYVLHAACLPLGIFPRPKRPGPCWEDSTDVFPRPLGILGNSSEVDRLRNGTWSDCGSRRRRRTRARMRSQSSCLSHREVDLLFLNSPSKNNDGVINLRNTLLVIGHDYDAQGENSVNVKKGEVVALLNDRGDDWYWVCTRDGKEGVIPAVIVADVVYNEIE